MEVGVEEIRVSLSLERGQILTRIGASEAFVSSLLTNICWRVIESRDHEEGNL